MGKKSTTYLRDVREGIGQTTAYKMGKKNRQIQGIIT